MSWYELELRGFFDEAQPEKIRESHFAFSTSRVLSVKKNLSESAFVAQQEEVHRRAEVCVPCRRTIAQKCAKKRARLARAKWMAEKRVRFASNLAGVFV